MERDPLDDELARLGRLTDGLAPPGSLAPRLFEALALRASAPATFWELAQSALRSLLAPSAALALAALAVAAWEQSRLDAAVADAADAADASGWSAEP